MGNLGNIMAWVAYMQQIEKKRPQLSGHEGLFVLAVSVRARNDRYHALSRPVASSPHVFLFRLTTNSTPHCQNYRQLISFDIYTTKSNISGTKKATVQAEVLLVSFFSSAIFF